MQRKSLMLGSYFAFAACLAFAMMTQAQTFSVIHTFTGGDGAGPATLTMDRADNLYGTTFDGASGAGTVYELKRSGSDWVLNRLYSFTGAEDGGYPKAGVIFGPDGLLYGTTAFGGDLNCDRGAGCGTVFQLRPAARVCTAALCPWTETVLYSFTWFSSDGAFPGYGNLIFDQAGNIYGTTVEGGVYNSGAVYGLTRTENGWAESIIYSFTGGNDGAGPWSGLTLDSAGNLYGTTGSEGAHGGGTVYELTPSGSGWTEKTLYSFQAATSGYDPYAGLTFDPFGNLYGATLLAGPNGGGVVFQLSPDSGGNWTFRALSNLAGFYGPRADLAFDAAGDLYGTAFGDGLFDNGNVFKLSPDNGGWAYRDLHDFTLNGSNGEGPTSNVLIDDSGILYGTAGGGAYEKGVVWEITP